MRYDDGKLRRLFSSAISRFECSNAWFTLHTYIRLFNVDENVDENCWGVTNVEESSGNSLLFSSEFSGEWEWIWASESSL